jgi:hypothetical protein
MIERAGLPYIRPHDLRHTAATLMLWQDIHPEVVSEMLSHASVAIALDLYSHALPHTQREAVDRMGTLWAIQRLTLSARVVLSITDCTSDTGASEIGETGPG